MGGHREGRGIGDLAEQFRLPNMVAVPEGQLREGRQAP
nr:MAG TPA: hypothetical protein [Caudoviricetes sp.]